MRRVLAGLVGLVLVLVVPGFGVGWVSAQVGGQQVTYVDQALTVAVGTADQLRLGPGGGVVRSGIRCVYYDFDGEAFDVTPMRPFERDEPWVVTCWRPADGPDPWNDALPGFPQVTTWNDRIIGPVVNDWEAGEYALDSIGLETPTVELSPAGAQLVGVPTWLAVTSRLDYGSATASAGPTWATVTPIFRNARWVFSDGTSVVCTTDVATTWNPALTGAAAAEQTSACTHTFNRHTAVGQPITGTVTVTWDVWMTSDQSPGGRWWGPVSTSAPIAVDVRQLQAAID